MDIHHDNIKIGFNIASSENLLASRAALCFMYLPITDTRRLTTWIRSEKCVVRRLRRCANVIEFTYTNLNSIAYYTPRLYGIAYCS